MVKSNNEISDAAHDLACDIMEGKFEGTDDDVSVGAIIVLAGAAILGGKMTREEFLNAANSYMDSLGMFVEQLADGTGVHHLEDMGN
jgi:hypothetical protein